MTNQTEPSDSKVDRLLKKLGIDNYEGKHYSLLLARIGFYIFFAGLVLSYLLYPASEYSITEDFISTLGTSDYGWILNIALIITGSLLLPVFFLLYSILDDYTDENTRDYLRYGAITGVISQIALILVGVFVDTPGRDIHSVVAGIFFFSLVFTIGFLSSMIRQLEPGTIYDDLDTAILRYGGYFLVILAALMIIINLVLPEWTLDALLQKIVVLSTFVYLSYFISQIRNSYIAQWD